MLSSRQAHLRNELASTSDSSRIWHILNSFYRTVACAHPPCPSSSLHAIVAPIQDIDDSAVSFHKITPVEVYETARMLSSKSKEQSPDGLPWKHLESLLLHYCLFYLRYLTVRSAQILIQISGREPLLFH